MDKAVFMGLTGSPRPEPSRLAPEVKLFERPDDLVELAELVTFWESKGWTRFDHGDPFEVSFFRKPIKPRKVPRPEDTLGKEVIPRNT